MSLNIWRIELFTKFDCVVALVNTINKMDCVEGIKQLRSESIDIVIADPPYNRRGVDYGEGFEVMPFKDYFAWCEIWISECKRVLKPKGTMFIYGYDEILARISSTLPIEGQRWLIWHYRNLIVPNAQFWQRTHQSIICHWKGRKPSFNLDAVREPYTEEYAKQDGRILPPRRNRFSKGGMREATVKIHPNGALPRDVFNIPLAKADRIMFCNTCSHLVTPKHRKEHEYHDLLIHPTQKPFALTEKLILSCKPEGEFNVLVPFCGSGSECLIALKHGGRFFTFELNPDYVKLASLNLSYYLNTRSYFI